MIVWFLMGMAKYSQSYQNSNFAMSLQYLKKEVRYKVDILHADKHRVSYKLVLTLWPSKFPTSWYYHYWWASILKAVKITSLKYLKKEVRDGVHFFHSEKYRGFYKLPLLFLMEVIRHAQSVQNRKLVIFFAISSEKGVATALCPIVM